MIFTVIIYLFLAATTVYLSIKSATYVDQIDKKTTVSGAFIGGVILAAITSLPELITSLSSTILLNKADFVVGNILGSNIFNLCITATVVLFFSKSFIASKVGKSHTFTALITIIMYIVVSLPIMFNMEFSFITVSVYSFIILALYLVSIKLLASDDTENDNDGEESPLTVKQLVVRFVFTAIGLLISSVLLTYTTDIISQKLPIGTTLIGALFLGVATSLPELSSSIALTKYKNYNALIGNVIGSNCFNFFIFVVADISYFNGSIYNSSNAVSANQSKLLIIFGLLSTVATLVFLLLKQKNVKKSLAYIIPSAIVLISYISFLALSV